MAVKTAVGTAITVAAIVAACNSTPPPHPADSIEIGDATGPPPTRPYVLQPGDVIAVKFYSAKQLNENNIVVRPDGAVSLPYAGEVQVAGRSPAEVEAELRERYRGELAETRGGASPVTVIVRKLGSYQVHVGGEVEKDGRVRIENALTVMEAIQRAGGFLETADPSHVVLIRNEPDGRVGYVVDLEPVLDGTAPEKDVVLEPSDIVFVPPSTIADLNLVVKQYIRNMLPIEPGFAIAAP